MYLNVTRVDFLLGPITPGTALGARERPMQSLGRTLPDRAPLQPDEALCGLEGGIYEAFQRVLGIGRGLSIYVQKF